MSRFLKWKSVPLELLFLIVFVAALILRQQLREARHLTAQFRFLHPGLT